MNGIVFFFFSDTPLFDKKNSGWTTHIERLLVESPHDFNKKYKLNHLRFEKKMVESCIWNNMHQNGNICFPFFWGEHQKPLETERIGIEKKCILSPKIHLESRLKQEEFLRCCFIKPFKPFQVACRFLRGGGVQGEGVTGEP